MEQENLNETQPEAEAQATDTVSQEDSEIAKARDAEAERVVNSLDPRNDIHWTDAGLPSLDAVNDLRNMDFGEFKRKDLSHIPTTRFDALMAYAETLEAEVQAARAGNNDAKPVEKVKPQGVYVGDYVCQRDGGGPAMLLSSITDDGMCQCHWNATDGSAHEGKFPASELVKVQPDS